MRHLLYKLSFNNSCGAKIMVFLEVNQLTINVLVWILHKKIKDNFVCVYVSAGITQ